MGTEKDKIYGQGLLEAMRPFIEHLIMNGLKNRTIRRHMDNLWVLGGEIIRSVSTNDEYGNLTAESLRNSVGPGGGPYCSGFQYEWEMSSYDTTCRKLHKFLEGSKQTRSSPD
jgi:hypothetical protein